MQCLDGLVSSRPASWPDPLAFNTVSIWHSLDQAQTQTPPAAQPLPEPTWLVIWRKGWRPHFRTLTAIEHAALARLRAGASFAAVCAELSQQFPEQQTTHAAAGLRAWLEDELIVALTGRSRDASAWALAGAIHERQALPVVRRTAAARRSACGTAGRIPGSRALRQLLLQLREDLPAARNHAGAPHRIARG